MGSRATAIERNPAVIGCTVAILRLPVMVSRGIPVFEKVVDAFAHNSTGVPEKPSAEYSIVAGQALAKQGWFNFRLGRLQTAIQMLHQSIDLLDSLGDQPAMAFSLTSLGGILSINNNDPQGEVMLFESLKISRAIGDPWLSAITLANMAIAALTWRGYEEADGLFREAVVEARHAGDPAITAFIPLTYSGLAAFSARESTRPMISFPKA